MDDASILVAGEVLVDLFGSAERLRDSATFERHAGGAPANVAIGLKRLGLTPSLWTSTGADPFGRFLRETLREHELPDRFVSTDPQRNTALAFVSEEGDSTADFRFYMDETATVTLDPATVPDEFLRTCDWMHVGGTLLAIEPARSAIFALLDRAVDHDCLISFDPNTRSDLWRSEETCREVLREAFSLADVLKVSPQDIASLPLPTDSPTELADELLALGPHTTFLTLGPDGTYARTTTESPWREESVRVPGHRVAVVDETGAGDAFMAAIIAELLDDSTDFESAVEFANAAGALATTREGALGRLPSRKEIVDFLG